MEIEKYTMMQRTAQGTNAKYVYDMLMQDLDAQASQAKSNVGIKLESKLERSQADKGP